METQLMDQRITSKSTTPTNLMDTETSLDLMILSFKLNRILFVFLLDARQDTPTHMPMLLGPKLGTILWILHSKKTFNTLKLLRGKQSLRLATTGLLQMMVSSFNIHHTCDLILTARQWGARTESAHSLKTMVHLGKRSDIHR